MAGEALPADGTALATIRGLAPDLQQMRQHTRMRGSRAALPDLQMRGLPDYGCGDCPTSDAGTARLRMRGLPDFGCGDCPVSYTHLTLPTIYSV